MGSAISMEINAPICTRQALVNKALNCLQARRALQHAAQRRSCGQTCCGCWSTQSTWWPHWGSRSTLPCLGSMVWTRRHQAPSMSCVASQAACYRCCCCQLCVPAAMHDMHALMQASSGQRARQRCSGCQAPRQTPSLGQSLCSLVSWVGFQPGCPLQGNLAAQCKAANTS